MKCKDGYKWDEKLGCIYADEKCDFTPEEATTLQSIKAAILKLFGKNEEPKGEIYFIEEDDYFCWNGCDKGWVYHCQEEVVPY